MKHLLLLALFLLAGFNLLAHPAGNVTLQYDATTKLVSVGFEHGVKSALDHFIDSVTLKLNGKTIVTQNMSIQETLAGGSYTYKVLNLKKGDSLEAITNCNKGGKKSAKITLQ